MKLSIIERVHSYNHTFRRFPRSRLNWTETPDGHCFDGMWWLGNDYRKKSDPAFYGAYPGNYLERVMSLFPDAKRVMHLFSGSLPPGDYTRVDCSRPTDIQCDAHKLGLLPGSPFNVPLFDLILADPPYSAEDAAKYGTPMIRRKVVLQECAKVLQPGGFLVWLDQQVPMWRKVDFRCVGVIGLVTSAGHRVRVVSIFERPGEFCHRRVGEECR